MVGIRTIVVFLRLICGGLNTVLASRRRPAALTIDPALFPPRNPVMRAASIRCGKLYASNKTNALYFPAPDSRADLPRQHQVPVGRMHQRQLGVYKDTYLIGEGWPAQLVARKLPAVSRNPSLKRGSRLPEPHGKPAQ